MGRDRLGWSGFLDDLLWHPAHERAPDLLTDVATAYDEAATASQTPERHQAVVEIVQRILAGKNGMRL